MTAAALANNIAVLSSPFDTGAINLAVPTPTQMAQGFTPNVDVIKAEQQNYLHNVSSSFVYLAQLLGLALPFNPVAGASIVATPAGGIVSLKDSVSGATQFYVALNNRAIGYTDPSADPTNWAMINYAALAKLTALYADATGTADALLASYPNVPYPVLLDGFRITVNMATPNLTTTPTLAVTLNGNALTARTIYKFLGQNVVPVAAGDLRGNAILDYDLPNTRWILINPATAAHSIIGTSRNLIGSAAGGTKTASWTADQLIVFDTLNGVSAQGNSLSLSFNGAGTGAGGMDTGATPTSGSLYIYAIFNGSAWNTLGTIAGAGAQIYSGANMPAGYTHSCLIWSDVTDGSAFIQKFNQQDREIYHPERIVFTATAGVAALTVQSLSSAVPTIAKKVYGVMGLSSAIQRFMGVASDTSYTNVQWQNNPTTAGMDTQFGAASFALALITAQTLYWIAQDTSANYNLRITGHTF